MESDARSFVAWCGEKQLVLSKGQEIQGPAASKAVNLLYAATGVEAKVALRAPGSGGQAGGQGRGAGPDTASLGTQSTYARTLHAKEGALKEGQEAH